MSVKKKYSYEEFAKFFFSGLGIDYQEGIRLDSFDKIGIDSFTLYSILVEAEDELGLELELDNVSISDLNSLSKVYGYVFK